MSSPSGPNQTGTSSNPQGQANSSDASNQRQQSASSYTPAPLRKTRSVSGTHPAVTLETSSDFSSTQASQSSTESEQRVESTSTSDVVRPSSIRLSLDTFGQAVQDVVEKERRIQNKLAEFEPFSATSYSSNNADVSGETWGQQEHSSTPVDPSVGYDGSSYDPLPDLYRGRRRMLILICVMGLCAVWLMGMLMQVGVDRLLKDPYGETVKVLSQSSSDAEQEHLAVTASDTQVIVEKIQAFAQINDVRMIKPRVYLVRGVLSNEGDQPISAALLKLTLRQPVGAETPWIQRFEFNCCQDLSIGDLSAREKRTMLKSLTAGEMRQEGMVRLAAKQRQSFEFLASLDPSIKVGRGMSPRVDIEVVFAE